MERPAMAMGIETEYSIYPKWHLAKHYEGDATYKVAVDAMVEAASSVPQIMGPWLRRTNDGNAFSQFFPNGARFYNDMQAPEYCTPECPNPYFLVVHDQAGMLIEQMLGTRASEILGCPIDLHKKNSDGHGHAYGCHENYTVAPRLFGLLTKEVYTTNQAVFATFAIVRSILTGAGKVGVEEHGRDHVFQMTQRLDFVTNLVHSSTTSNRPLLQTREEAHANKEHWQRFHYIMGDANMCQVSTYLKTGLTALLLMLLQDFHRSYKLPTFRVDPEYFPRMAQFVSWDVGFEAKEYPVFMTRSDGAEIGGKMSAPDILSYYLDRLAEYVQERPFFDEQEREMYADIVSRAVSYLALIRNGRCEELYGTLDWVTKRGILDHFLKKNGKTWEQAKSDEALRRRMRAIADHAYTSLDQETGLYWQLLRAGHIERVVKDREIQRAISRPPPGRAELRYLLTNLLLDDIIGQNGVGWSYVKVPHPRKPKGKEPWTIKLQDPMLLVSPVIREMIEKASNVADIDMNLKTLDKRLKKLVREQSQGGGNATEKA